MDIRDRRGLKAEARAALSAAAYHPKRLVLINAGASAAVLLVLAAIDMALQAQIDGTGGLSGLGTRSVLSTVQMLLQYASVIVLPFWDMGFTFAMLSIWRRKRAEPDTLLDGFRNFGPVLRFFLLQELILMAICLVCVYFGAILYMITPFAQPLAARLMADPTLAEDPTALLDDPAIVSSFLPMYLIVLGLMLVVAVPIWYRLRMGTLALADDPKKGAFAALRESLRLMRGNRIALLRLDLSFWWYYGLLALSSALVYGDTLLGILGITLPLSPIAAYFLFYFLGLAFQIAVSYLAKDHVAVTYAAVYDALRTAPPLPPTPVPKNQPWSY